MYKSVSYIYCVSAIKDQQNLQFERCILINIPALLLANI